LYPYLLTYYIQKISHPFSLCPDLHQTNKQATLIYMAILVLKEYDDINSVVAI